MSRDASVTLEFAGEDRLFRLRWGELIRLQEARDEGPFMTFQRLFSTGWRLEDLTEVIRFGLIGGGMAEADANRLIKSEVQGTPPFASLILAQKIMAAAFKGAPDEEKAAPKSEAPKVNGSIASSEASSPLGPS